MAEIGTNGRLASSAVAHQLGRSVTSAASTRDTLIKKGMIYAVQHGEIGFTVPLFGDFMRRAMP